jgi:uncharacterized protein (UPF0147 family)
MTTKKKSEKPSTLPNAPQDHFISAYAHHIEEAIVHLHSITLDKSVPKAERLHIRKMKKNLAILHQREWDRQSSSAN